MKNTLLKNAFAVAVLSLVIGISEIFIDGIESTATIFMACIALILWTIAEFMPTEKRHGKTATNTPTPIRVTLAIELKGAGWKQAEQPKIIGIAYLPDYEHELVPHNYEYLESYKNVTVELLECKDEDCDEISIGWKRQPDTEVIDPEKEQKWI